ncbi:hypothetical protein BKA80DRAFT_268501 [Phyllosticta citrichinensis]
MARSLWTAMLGTAGCSSLRCASAELPKTIRASSACSGATSPATTLPSCGFATSQDRLPDCPRMTLPALVCAANTIAFSESRLLVGLKASTTSSTSTMTTRRRALLCRGGTGGTACRASTILLICTLFRLMRGVERWMVHRPLHRTLSPRSNERPTTHTSTTGLAATTLLFLPHRLDNLFLRIYAQNIFPFLHLLQHLCVMYLSI